MLRRMSFDEAVANCNEATKENKTNLCHTWWGWVSKGVLHVVSSSGARSREIWHFDVRKNARGRIFFKNTTGSAFVYVRPGAQSRFEEAVYSMGIVSIEYVDQIEIEMLTRGTGCNHSTNRNAPWYSIVTDGEVELIREAGAVDHCVNQHHVGCPTGPDAVSVKGGTFALQFNKGSLWRVVVTQDGKTAALTKLREKALKRFAEWQSWVGIGRRDNPVSFEEAKTSWLKETGWTWVWEE